MIPSEEQLRDFRELGFFSLGRVFDEKELGEIRDEYDRILRNPLEIGEDSKSPFHYAPLLHLQSSTLCRLATSPKLIELVVTLLDSDVRLYWDQAVSKPAGALSDVPWHQDNGYAPVIPEEYVTCTVALDETTKENGCLWILPGSHRNGVRPHRRTDAFFHQGYDGAERGVPAEQAEGDVLVFSSLTMHRTGGNRTPGARRSWVIQFCRADTRHGETGILLDDRLLLSKDRLPLAEPYREREMDLSALRRRQRRER